MAYRSDEKVNYISNLQNFHRKIKEKNYPKDAKVIMELAAGKLNDIRNWIACKYKKVYAIEIDSDSIARGKEEYKKFANQIVIVYIQADLTKDTKEIMEKFKEIEKVDSIICNFGIQFLMKDKETILNLINMVKFFLKPGGKFCIHTLDGNKIFNELAKIYPTNPEELININTTISNTFYYKEYDLIYFGIQRLYLPKEKMANYGDKINVFVVSIGKWHSEYLVNKNYLIETMEENEFTNTSSISFIKYMKDFSFIVLGDAEKKYSSLHIYLEFTKM